MMGAGIIDPHTPNWGDFLDHVEITLKLWRALR